MLYLIGSITLYNYTVQIESRSRQEFFLMHIQIQIRFVGQLSWATYSTKVFSHHALPYRKKDAKGRA